MDDSAGELSFFPFHVHDKASSCAKTFDGAVGPLFWQCREQMDLVCMALQKHFCDGSGSSEVAVDLERRVVIEKVRVCRFI